MRTNMAPIADDRSSPGSTDEHDASSAGTNQAGQKPAFIRVPTAYLGKVLDHGKYSAPAIHMLAEKMRHGPGYALNWRQLIKPRGLGGLEMSKRAFHGGLTVLIATVLDRRQGGRSRGGHGAFAREKLLLVEGSYVLMPEAL